MNKYLPKKTFIFLFLFGLSLLTSLSIGIGDVSAANTGKEVDKPANITFTRINYGVIRDSNDKYWVADTQTPTDDPARLRFNKEGSDTEYIQLTNVGTTGNKWSMDLLVFSSTSSTLNGSSTTYYKSGLKANSGNYTDTYYWVNKSTIARYGVSADGNNMSAITYSYDQSQGLFIESGVTSCPDRIKVTGNSGNITVGNPTIGDQAIGIYSDNGTPHARILYANNKAGDACYTGTKGPGSSTDNGQVTITLADNNNIDPSSTNGGGVGLGNTTPGVTTGDDVANSCYSALPVFGWILCPVVDLADMAFSWIRGAVFNLLNVPSATINSSSGLKSVWSVTKNLATAGLVLVALVMVAGQIFNFDFISAYTVKKVLPRLIIAAIAMQLSWFIFTLLIQLTNSVATGIYSLLINAFGAQDIMDILGGLRSGGANITAGAVTVLGTIGGAVGIGVVAGMFANGGALMIVFAMISVLISIIIVVFTLVVRQMMIIILLVLSPLALLAWILPGTQNLWKSWWQLFSRLLAMYPLIAILFAAGAIAAKTAVAVGVTNGQNGSLPLIMAVILYFAPLFLVPSTFKFAGGMFTTVSASLNKLGSKAKSAGYFGTRARAKESYNENKKARGLELSGSDSSTWRGRLNRQRGRLMAGTMGASGSYADKLRESEIKQDFQNASLEADSVIKGAGPDYNDQRQARERILRAREGEELTIGNRKLRVTRRLQDATALKAAQNKEHDALDAYHTNTETRDAHGSPTGISNLTRLANANPEAFGILDKYTPDYSRSDPISVNPVTGEVSRSFQTAVNNFGNIGERRRREVTDSIRDHLLSGTEEQRRQAFGYLTTIARSPDVADADLRILATDVGIGDISRLRTDPNARLDIDPTSPRGYRVV